MIGYLEGKVKHTAPGKMILYANGIGFLVYVPDNLVFVKDQSASLYIHTHLREDSLALYGFQSANHLSLFEMLIAVSGVGPKIGLTLLSKSSPDNITNAISESNLSFFLSISGIGKKTAQKIILDLKSKISKGDTNWENLQGKSDLVDALKNLGFQQNEISSIYPQIDSNLSLPEQIKKSLSLLKK